MTTVIALLASLGAMASDASASPEKIEGKWKFEYSCARATGMYAERCAEGDRDYFELDLLHGHGKVCGGYSQTAQLGNHVDEGDLSDWSFERTTSPERFKVHFRVSGTSGWATIRVRGDKLYWHVNEKEQQIDAGRLTWVFSPPDDAVLLRQKASDQPKLPDCGS